MTGTCAAVRVRLGLAGVFAMREETPEKYKIGLFENSKGIYAWEENIIGENNIFYSCLFILNDIIGDIIYTWVMRVSQPVE